MKKIFTLLLLSITSIAINAQTNVMSVYAKKSGKDIYYKVIKTNNKCKYYHVRNRTELSLDDIKFKNESLESNYNALIVDPVLLYGVRDSLSEIQDKKMHSQEFDTHQDPKVYLSTISEEYGDNRCVVALANSTEPIKSSSNIEAGKSYDLLKVVCAHDTTLNGCPIICQDITRRKSNILGSEGRLVIRPRYKKTEHDNLSNRQTSFAEGLTEAM